MYALVRPLLWGLEPEKAHRLALLALRTGLMRQPVPAAPRRVFGLDFPNPLGLAAGFDKDGEAIAGAFQLGFGFVEIGTVTPKPQPGNPKPRLFRAAASCAVLNRMGFPGKGMDYVRRNLEAFRSGNPRAIVGVNIGKNKDQDDARLDYVAGLRCFEDVASYLAINISSPNTPGLRGLQGKDELTRLLDAVLSARRTKVPVLVKLAPDLDLAACEEIAGVLLNAGVDGAIVSNTTLSRPGGIFEGHAGGVSGRPLFELATRTLGNFYNLTGGRLPLVGAGGIDGPDTARAKFKVGASLIQLYSALVFEGPGLIRRILEGIANDAEKS